MKGLMKAVKRKSDPAEMRNLAQAAGPPLGAAAGTGFEEAGGEHI